MATTNHERVGKAMELLKGGLGPFVEREIASAYRDRAAAEAGRFTRFTREGTAVRPEEAGLFGEADE